ncbi:lysophospholipase [Hansschlegelia zhihuaiae]|uniref:Lysophospholipase n=1 Tax=Hansschlegelia zhihuaiae TaxID=405005 RepID=A0A4Q0MP10_9HYPH|nr:lysophospholipase [Hansschlegelia zhihuaiae]RXF75530.1 lysophospholipase [Hansschlegelia zhihuaiae]
MTKTLRSLHRSALLAGAVAFALASVCAPTTARADEDDAQTAAAGEVPQDTLKSPMHLKDEGVFFVNGDVIKAKYPTSPDPVPGRVMINQMYVHYRIPVSAKKTPVVMVHGGGLTGVTYETTPDGREGWATYFVRKGYPVYVVDIPGRGRSGFNVEAINEAKETGDVTGLPVIRRTTLNDAWASFRFGPEYKKKYPGVKYPLDHVTDFAGQGVPYGELTLEGGALVQNANAVTALFEKIGPAILLVHSQSGPTADMVVGRRPDLVKAVINVEGNQLTIPTDEQIAAYRNVPDLEIFGDNVEGNPSSTGQSRLDGRTAVVKRIRKAGGDAKVVQLPSVGFKGNTHMLMQDRNNLKVADYLLDWLAEKVKE